LKKLLYTFLFAAFVLFSTTVVNASDEVYHINREGIQITQDEYNNLLNVGFTEKQIDRMDYQTFVENKDIEGTIVSRVGQYIKTSTVMRNGIQYHTSEILTEDEALEEVARRKEQPTRYASGDYYNGLAYDTYKYVATTIVNLGDDIMRYKADTTWLEMPSVRSYDILGIGMEADKVQLYTTIYFRQDWLTTGGTFGHSTSCYPKEQSTGASVMFKLPTGSLEQLESYAYYNVAKKTGVTEITSLTASGDYAHATTNVTDAAFNYFSINYGTGLVISPPYHNSYDDMAISQAMFVGTW
jgi:hypothetical protein